mgnify:CR=1 FL=1
MRFVSYEPALGAVNFERHLYNAEGNATLARPMIDWCIIGAESGAKARPFNVAWARSAITQCRAAGVAVFVKQLGARPCDYEDEAGETIQYELKERKGGDMNEWVGSLYDLRVREWPASMVQKATK